METKQSSNRLLAFTAIVFSIVSIIGCLLAFPLVFHYMQTMEASTQVELDFCKSRSRDMLNEMLDIQDARGQSTSGRVARTASHSLNFWSDRVAKDYAQPAANPSAAQQSYGGCCTCHRGPSGPPGPPGRDGGDGGNGQNGQPGDRGDPAPSNGYSYGGPQQCPCELGPAGDQGPAGRRGPDGLAGDPGPSSAGDGKPGDQGPRGPAGENGRAGQNGQKGPNGDPGRATQRAGAPGAPGCTGRAGAPGPAGQPGNAGRDGQPGGAGGPGDVGPAGANGRQGPTGSDGDQGKQGDPGYCNHCPPARLAPGY